MQEAGLTKTYTRSGLIPDAVLSAREEKQGVMPEQVNAIGHLPRSPGDTEAGALKTLSYKSADSRTTPHPPAPPRLL